MVEFLESESDGSRETSIRRRSDFDIQFSISPYGSINRYECVELSNSNILFELRLWGSLVRDDTRRGIISMTIVICNCVLWSIPYVYR